MERNNVWRNFVVSILSIMILWQVLQLNASRSYHIDLSSFIKKTFSFLDGSISIWWYVTTLISIIGLWSVSIHLMFSNHFNRFLSSMSKLLLSHTNYTLASHYNKFEYCWLWILRLKVIRESTNTIQHFKYQFYYDGSPVPVVAILK